MPVCAVIIYKVGLEILYPSQTATDVSGGRPSLLAETWRRGEHLSLQYLYLVPVSKGHLAKLIISRHSRSIRPA